MCPAVSRARQGTYSIVARDPQSGALGVAVQSHWFSVGSVVTWARAGVGAVATQANAEPAYGPHALERMARGASAQQALGALLSDDASAASRQVAVIDARGGLAVHTGEQCMPFAGHVVGQQFSCQANVMASAAVWPAMAQAFDAAQGPFALRLLAALDGAEAAGGDIRGRQSAALLVVPAAGEEWVVDVCLRVEDHPQPNAELRRLLVLHDAYELAGEGDAMVAEGRHDEAADRYRRASALAPENHELLFWSGLGTAQEGDVEEGVRQVRAAIALQPGWAELLTRLDEETAPAAGLVRQRLAGDS